MHQMGLRSPAELSLGQCVYAAMWKHRLHQLSRLSHSAKTDRLAAFSFNDERDNLRHYSRTWANPICYPCVIDMSVEGFHGQSVP